MEKLENNSLYYSDCLSLLERMPESCFTLAYLDPPWNTGSDFIHIEQNEKTPRRDYFTFISNVFQQIRRVLNESGTVFVHTNPSLETPFRFILEQVFEGRFVTEIILPGKIRHLSRID
ncbi:MAG: DNA methyltransferase, partial [Bacillota bacterium]